MLQKKLYLIKFLQVLSDLEKVTRQAKAMVSIYGLNETLGNITYYDSSGQTDYNFSKPYSEQTAQVIDKEISKIIEKQYSRAISLLKKSKDKLKQLADRLLEKEVIFKDDLENILGKRPYKTNNEKIEEAKLQKEKNEIKNGNLEKIFGKKPDKSPYLPNLKNH